MAGRFEFRGTNQQQSLVDVILLAGLARLLEIAATQFLIAFVNLFRCRRFEVEVQQLGFDASRFQLVVVRFDDGQRDEAVPNLFGRHAAEDRAGEVVWLGK